MSAAEHAPSAASKATAPNAKLEKQPAGAGRMPFEEVEPWPEPVDLGVLLNHVQEILQRHIVADQEVLFAAVLWIAMTYLVGIFDTAALLIITAPEMRCGKSEFKRLIGRMVYRPLHADNMSVAVLFRCLDLWHATVLVDEFDTFVKNNEELRGVFNAGHQRGGCVWRCTGDDFVPTPFDVYGPKVLAGIGRLAPTLTDRGIVCQLRRKLPTEVTMPLRDVPQVVFREIQSKLGRMAQDHADQIATARPAMPDTLSDRARDNWRPLFQIAQVAGAEWPSHARRAALKLSSNEEDGRTVGVDLLSDIQEAFAGKNADRLSSSSIIDILCNDEEKRWATYNRGRPITPAQVAKLLRGYGIYSKTVRLGSTTLKGYQLTQFDDAFARYLLTDRVSDVTSSPREKAGHAAVTPPLRPAMLDVTCGTSDDAGRDGVTAETRRAFCPAQDSNLDLALAEFRALLLQSRLNSFVDDDERLDFTDAGRQWPEGLPLDYVANRLKSKLRHVDYGLRAATSRRLYRQLVEHGELVLRNDLLYLPKF